MLTIGMSIPTLKKYYGDELAAVGLRRGRKAYQPTERERQMVTAMAAVGASDELMAKLLQIPKATLQAHFKEEREVGRIQANFQVGCNLLAAATGDTTRRATVKAMIWWTKARMGWTDHPP